MGFELKSQAVQLGLNFSVAAPELFAGKEMGEDALRVLAQYLKLHTRIQADMIAEIPLVNRCRTHLENRVLRTQRQLQP